jgi:UDP-N-acetylmuramyl pentapeptide synthase
MSLLSKVVGAYLCNYPKRLTYLWQGSDYRSGAFIKWWWRVSDFRTVARRGDVVATKASRVVHGVTLLSLGTYLLLSLLSILLVRHSGVAFSLVVFVSIVLLPASVALFTMPVVWLLRAVYQTPKEQRLTKRAHDIFAKHPGVVIAVAGSYGKTTMKELLAAVLAREKKVAYTEGNRNVLTSIAQFATTLDGDEDIVIVEFGEG